MNGDKKPEAYYTSASTGTISGPGWFVWWPNGLNSPMPDEATARLCAGAGELREIVEESIEPGVFGKWLSVEDPSLVNTNLLDLCKTHGFGAVMSYVSYLWSKHTQHKGSEHTVAACASVRRSYIARALAALANVEAKKEPANG